MTVEIIGRSCVAAGAKNTSEFLAVLRDQSCTISRISEARWEQPRFWHPKPGTQGKAYTFAAGIIDDIYNFDPDVYGLSKREASYMDPQQRVLLQLVWRALEDASLSVAQLQNERVGVYVGASSLDNANLYSEDPASGGPYFMTGNTLSIVANRISHIFGLHGPSMTIDTACSSSLVALDQAVKALQAGQIDTAIVGGINLLTHPFSFVGFSQARMLSPEGLCRAYGEGGQGYVRAEGGAAIVLRRSQDAEQSGDRSYATIVASGVNSAGRTNGISLPSREAQAALLETIYDSSIIDANQLAFIEGHGTGTAVGDPAEVWALGTAIGQKRSSALPIGSVKSNIGHAEPASGLLGLMKAVLALENDFIPATLHAETLNQQIDFDALNIRVNTRPTQLLRSGSKRLAGINSFGFGGTNAHIVISDPIVNAAPTPENADEGSMFMVSAHTKKALETLLDNYRSVLSEEEPAVAQKLAAAAYGQRTTLRHRFVVPSLDPSFIVDAIDDHINGGDVKRGQIGFAPASAAKIAFVFTGNGSQWAGMGASAYEKNELFRERFDHYSALFDSYLPLSLIKAMKDPCLGDLLSDTTIAQPMLFAVQAAIHDCLMAAGVKPAAVYGHSVGELAAAYASGILSAEEAVKIVAIRSQHQHQLAGEGTMAAAVQTEAAFLDFAKTLGLTRLCVAAVNSHNSITVSGPVDEIQAYREAARRQKIIASILDINYPFHHPDIDRVKSAFLAALPSIVLQPAKIPFISTVTGSKLDGADLGPAYWWSNVREPVHFQAGTEVALEDGCNLFVEISPRAILQNYILDSAKQRSLPAMAIQSLSKTDGNDGLDPIERTIAQIVANGGQSSRMSIEGSRNAFIRLPELPFDAIDLRTARTSDRVDVYGREAEHPFTLLGWQVDPNSSSWKNHIDALLFPDLAEHVVDGKAIMPGSGFIDIAIGAAQRFFKSTDVEVTNLEILRPLELQEKNLVELSTTISAETGYIEIRSREYLSEDDWTIHAVARSRKPVKKLAEIDVDFGNVTAMTSVSAKDAYSAAKQFGLDYGPCFQLLSKAAAYGQRFVSVDLREPAPAAHPHLKFNLHPISVDAAFHGLVALFGELSGDIGGAPYIPVRFGSIRINSASPKISRAVIEIQRFSAYSIKARFCLYDADNQLIGSLEDCRFRRTYLRKHKTLDTMAYHYQAIPSALQGTGSLTNVSGAKLLLGNIEQQPIADSLLLLDAAVYRACYDIASSLADEMGVVSAANLPGTSGFKAFVTSCLFTLEDAQLIEANDETWTIPSSISLPSVNSTLKRLNRDHPDTIAETVLLNDAYCHAMDSIAALQDDANHEVKPLTSMSAATLGHYETHSPSSQIRMDMVLAAVGNLLRSKASGVSLRILELGASSTAFSSKLAALAEDHKSTLTIIEPQEKRRGALEMSFEESPWVTVAKVADETLAIEADIIVSASGKLFDVLRQNDELRSRVATQVAAGCQLIAIDRSPSAYSDFTFGQTEGWFAQSASPAFPTGQIATSSQWKTLLNELGFEQPHVNEHDFAQGSLIVIEAMSDGAAASDTPVALDASPILVLNAEKSLPAEEMVNIGLSADDSIGTIAAKIDAAGGIQPLALYVVDDGEKDKSLAVQDHVLLLSQFAGYLQQCQEQGQPLGAAPLRLMIIAHGGAASGQSHYSSVESAVWTFARVLQNEYDVFDIYLLDADPADSRTMDIARDILSKAPANREWSISPESGALQELRVVRGPLAARNGLTSDYQAAFIRQKTASRVDSIIWQEGDIPKPSENEVVVSVAATGLNFRDVMWAMGLLPEEALEEGFAGATIGMEFSGTVIAHGSAVQDMRIGQKVMGIGPAAFATHVTVDRAGVTAIPDGLNLRAAATVPVTFLTAYYAMVELGRIRAGDTILIHGAAGGVGLAAVQIAKLKGATIIATAGTPEKRNFLAMLGVDHIFDSRSLSFVDDVLEVTNGEGVELVLNSLFSEAMERSIELLKPFGRFLELGKRDYYSDRKIGLRPFRRNISYFGIDADQLLIHEPQLTARIFRELSQLFADAALSPLPHRCFGFDEIGQAFRLMQNAGHIGKIVVAPPVPGLDKVAKRPAKQGLVLSEGTYLVVGGIGGFGLAAASWLAARGAKHIALSTRSGKADDETLAAIESWKKQGVSASIHACDVTNEKQLAALLNELRSSGPLVGIIHAAMVLDDALISNLNRERNRPVINTKAKGAELLDLLTRNDPIELFLLFSSATTMVGNPGQANYVAANGYLEGLARQRRSQGLAGLAVGFGAIADKGFLARNADVGDLLAKRIGKNALTAAEALRLVEDYMTTSSATSIDQAVVMISELDLAAASALAITRQPLFDAISKQGAHHSGASDGDQIDLVALIAGKDASSAQMAIHAVLAGEIGSILRVGPESVTPDKVLKDIGLDSLMAMELGMSLQQKTGLDIPLSGLNDGTTVADVTRKIHEKLGRNDQNAGDDTVAAPATATESLIEKLVVQHGGGEENVSEQMVDQDGYGR